MSITSFPKVRNSVEEKPHELMFYHHVLKLDMEIELIDMARVLTAMSQSEAGFLGTTLDTYIMLLRNFKGHTASESELVDRLVTNFGENYIYGVLLDDSGLPQCILEGDEIRNYQRAFGNDIVIVATERYTKLVADFVYDPFADLKPEQERHRIGILDMNKRDNNYHHF